jgi:hypothetical protein
MRCRVLHIPRNGRKLLTSECECSKGTKLDAIASTLPDRVRSEPRVETYDVKRGEP